MTKPRIGRPPLKPGEVTISKGVRLLADDWDRAEAVAASIGEVGVSAGLREIISQWRRMRGETQ